MASASLELPVCSRLLSEDEVAAHLARASQRADVADYVNAAFANAGLDSRAGPLDYDERRQLMAEAARHRDFLSSILPGDKLWITADPSSHPEAQYGAPYIVIVRGSTAITRYRLDDDYNLEWGSPILPSAKRLTRDQVIAIASEWVRGHYPSVPPAVRVQELTEQMLDRFSRLTDESYTAEKRSQLTSLWVVTFVFADTEDANGSGMPASLRVCVDDVTGQARLNAEGPRGG